MNWIKKRYDQFLLALLAVGLLACAVLIFLKVQNFGDNFTSAVTTIPQDNKVPPVPLEKIDAAKEEGRAAAHLDAHEGRYRRGSGTGIALCLRALRLHGRRRTG